MFIREIKVEDAENLIGLIKKVESQAKFMLMEAGERKTTTEQQRKQLEIFAQRNNSAIFVAEDEQGELVGYLIAIGGNTKKTKHSAYLVIGILEAYRGRGVGTRLFDRLDQWVIKSNISRLELTVVTENEAAIALYKKKGFEIEGVKRKTLLIDDEYYDEYFMSKLL